VARLWHERLEVLDAKVGDAQRLDEALVNQAAARGWEGWKDKRG